MSDSNTPAEKFKLERFTRPAAFLFLLFACYEILQPFLLDLLWSAILCYVTWPLYFRLRKIPLSPELAAISMVLPIGVLLLTPFLAAAFSFTDDINELLQWLNQSAHQWPEPPQWLQKIPFAGEQASLAWRNFGEDSNRLMNLARQYALTASGWLLQQSVKIAAESMHTFLSILVLFFFYRDGEHVVRHLTTGMRMIAGVQSDRILQITRTSVSAVVYGLLGTALAQALTSMIGFMIVGLPFALVVVLGFLAFFFMIIPTAGTLVWLPVAIWLLVQGEIGWAIFTFAWFLGFVGTIDNWLRPILISREVELPFILIVVGIFGGLFNFGFIGVFIGPTLLAMIYSLSLDWLKRHEQENIIG